jgi:phosphatidate cytidylyltransferase
VGHPSITEAIAHSSTSVTTTPARPKQFDIRRLYTAAVLIPAVYLIIVHLTPWALTLLLIAVGSLALLELYRLSFQSRLNHVLVGVGSATFVLTLARSHVSLPLPELLLGGAFMIAVTASFVATSAKYRWKDALITMFGVLYVGVTLSTIVSTRALPTGEFLVLFLAVVTWASDTGAYYAGTLWGKHLLMPSISPKKTVEGVLGGLILAVAAAIVAQWWFASQLSLLDAFILGVLLTGTGLIGDLFESMIKRRTGVKDSGGILPGHGGMLDRLDSLLFTAPTFYYYVAYVRDLAPPL